MRKSGLVRLAIWWGKRSCWCGRKNTNMHIHINSCNPAFLCFLDSPSKDKGRLHAQLYLVHKGLLWWSRRAGFGVREAQEEGGICVHMADSCFIAKRYTGCEAIVCAQSCLTLCNSMDCSPAGSSVHGIFQARILEWVVISYFRGSSRPRDQTRVFWVSCIDRKILYAKCHLGTPKQLCCPHFYFYLLLRNRELILQFFANTIS